jgi:hypothetical protein
VTLLWFSHATQVVYTGTNPQCTEYIFATSRPAADGLLALTFGISGFAMFAVLATARGEIKDEEFSWRTRWAFRMASQRANGNKPTNEVRVHMLQLQLRLKQG